YRHLSSRAEREADQINARHNQFRIGSIRCNANDTSTSAKRCGNVQIAVAIERQALRPAQSFIKDVRLTIRVNAPDAVEAGDCWASHIQRIIKTKREMESRNRRLDLRPGLLFADTIYFEDCSRAIADVHQTTMVEGDACRNAKITTEGNGFFERSNSVNHSFESTADKHLPVRTETNAGWIRDVSGVLRNIAAEIDSKQCHRQFLAARSGPSHEERTVVRIVCRIRNRMNVAGEFFRNRESGRLAQLVAAAQPYFDLSRCCFGNNGQDATRAQRYYLRRSIADQNGAARHITGI